VQLKTGDAIQGVISRRAWWWRFLVIDSPIAIEAKTSQQAKMDGQALIPKTNVSFIQRRYPAEA
jgi:hypothetical protein